MPLSSEENHSTATGWADAYGLIDSVMAHCRDLRLLVSGNCRPEVPDSFLVFPEGDLSVTYLLDEYTRRRSPAWLRQGLNLQWTPPDRLKNSRSARYFVDTNILMYARDTTTGAKHGHA